MKWLVPAGFAVTLGVYLILHYKETRLPAPLSPLVDILLKEVNPVTPSQVSSATVLIVVLEVDNYNLSGCLPCLVYRLDYWILIYGNSNSSISCML